MADSVSVSFSAVSSADFNAESEVASTSDVPVDDSDVSTNRGVFCPRNYVILCTGAVRYM